MDDHYAILGLPLGEEGFKLSEKEITKAYKSKALELHPDKKPDDPNAIANFQKLQTSYHILKDENARKIGVKFQRQSQQDPKRKRMKSELEKKERSTSAKATNVEDIIWRKLKEEIKSIRARNSNKSTPIATATVKKQSAEDKEEILKVNEDLVSYQAFEDSVLQKLHKAAKRQKESNKRS